MITIVGVGALGSHVALAARNLDTLKVVDFDRVDLHNTKAQFHSKQGIGKNKAVGLSGAILGLFGVTVAPVPHRITGDNAKAILEGSKVVLDCTDNLTARETIAHGCYGLKIPCLHGALSAAGDISRVMWDERFIPDPEGTEGEATCIDGEHLPFFIMTASLMTLEVQSFLKTGKRRDWLATPSSVLRVQ